MMGDPAALHQLLTPRAGRTRQSSSFGRDPERGSSWLGLRPGPAKRKRVLLAPGETHTLAAPAGAGLITRLWMTTFLPTNAHALRGLVLRFFWDGESHPSVECPFGDFFGAPFGRYRAYISQPMSLTSGGFNCLWPMPYAAGARLEVANEGTRTVEPFFYQVTYYELDRPPESELRFHAAWRRENPTRPGAPFTVLEAQGSGHYVGCHLFMQNLERWLRWPPLDTVFPYGFGMGMLEGWECLYVDGATTPAVIGTGTEDYFNGGWYYSVDGAFHAPYHGCTVRDYVRGRIAAYRFDVAAPVPFRRSLRVTLDHGFENRLAGDYTCVAYWYQTEPHRPGPALPPVPARQPVSPWKNALQALLALGVPATAGAALLWLLGRRRPGSPRR